MSYPTPMDYKNVIETLGGYKKLAGDLGETPDKVRKWHERNSIPSDYWHSVSVAAQINGHQVTLNQLAEIASRA